MSIVSRILPNERTRHVVKAAAIAFAMALIGLLSPLDEVVWLVESRINQKDISGEFVFVKADEDLTDPTRADRRVQLARSLKQLKRLGAERVVLDMVFDKPSTAGADSDLANAISELGDSIILSQKLSVRSPELGGASVVESSIDEIVGSAAVGVDNNIPDYLGYVWQVSMSEQIEGQNIASLPALLAAVPNPVGELYYIDYNFDPSEIVTLNITDFGSSAKIEDLRGAVSNRTVIVGHSAEVASYSISIPDYRVSPRSIVSIMAAETLKQGTQRQVGEFTLLASFVVGLLVVAQLRSHRTLRRAGYWALSLGTIAFLIYCNYSGSTAHLAHVWSLFLVFGLFRFMSKRKNKQLLFDERVQLPTFVALERDLAQSESVHSVSVVVAKLHRFDEVTSALSDEAIADYVQQIASRFRIAEQDLQVYTKGGKYLAWLSETSDRDMLESHLRGLRAVFALPLIVKEIPVDVGITFAADMTAEDNAARKIASASSTLEKTTESHEPVLFAEMASEGDRWWNISLQAKIDEALEQGHIYVVFQPKLNVRQGTVVGAEALVRWKDPERGNIAPNYFIEQCENAGRMDHLTRHVLREALLAAQGFAKTNAQFTVSVNISATMLRDYRVAEMVEEIVEKTGFNPRNLVLEITETSRIADYDIAFDVMTRLSLHGIKLSIDDFGVGSASMETLLRLPFDELKIDRAFIARMQDDQKARAISQMMIAFGKQTRISVVAEGVEDESNMQLLRDLGCEIVQGYHISKPLEKESFEQFQADNQREFSKRAING